MRCSGAACACGLSRRRPRAALSHVVRLLLLLLALALAAVAWGFVDAALPPVGLPPRAQQAVATALLLVAATNAAAGARAV